MKRDNSLGNHNRGHSFKPYQFLLVKLIYWFVSFRINLMSGKDAARFLMLLDSYLYHIQGTASIRYGNGIHTKHRHMKYHDFFTNRIQMNEIVLDVGCGIGIVSNFVAKRCHAKVIGIDLSRSNIERAQAEFFHENIIFIVGDALTDLPKERFDVVILSNVLEHIDERVDFLKRINLTVSPKRLLIRVPQFERDWRVPLKKELGLDYRLDSTHYIEYTYESFKDEMDEAGLSIKYMECRWGEIWAEVIPVDS